MGLDILDNDGRSYTFNHIKRVAFITKESAKEHLNKFYEIARKKGLKIVKKNPDIVFTIGGDGTLLSAEKKYPGIPKVPIRVSSLCQKCIDDYPFEKILLRIMGGSFKIKTSSKLELVIEKTGSVNNKMFDCFQRLTNLFKVKKAKNNILALNDITIRNHNSAKAIRFSLTIFDDETRGETFTKENPYQLIRDYPLLIGDGVVFSTPFGSTAYFSAITKKNFRKGYGIAFNNISTGLSSGEEERRSIIIRKPFKAKLILERGPAQVSVDGELLGIFNEGSTLIITPSQEKANIISVI